MAKNTKFVIHDHDAKRSGHHFDLRIEWDGVLKSWAIPKARMPEKGEKIMAVQTPDHPLDWYGFEGEITDEYGRGRVKIHDQGKCQILKWTKERIGVIFKGKKVKGTFWMIRLAGQTKNWIIIQGR